MPSSVNVNGVSMYKPGVYGTVDARDVGGVQAAFGNMAVVGAFPTLETNKPVLCASPQAIRALDPANLDFARIAKLAFNPCNDQAVSGAGTVTLVNAQTVAQANKVLPGGGVDSLVLKAKTWGQRGNQVWFRMAENVGDSTGRDFQFTQPGFAGETYTNVQSGILGNIKMDPAICTVLNGGNDTAFVDVNAATPALVVGWTKAVTIGQTINAGSGIGNLVVSGVVQVIATASVANAADIIWAIAGKNDAGVITTDTFTQLTNQQNGSPVDAGAVKWSELTSVTATTVSGTPTAISLKGNAFNLNLSQFGKVSDVLTFINNSAAKGWIANIKSPKSYQVPAIEMDRASIVSIKNVDTANVRADLWAIAQTLSASKIVTAARATGAITAPDKTNPAQGLLLGGAETTPVTVSTAYPAALATIADKDVQVVAVLESDIEAAKALKVHCTNAAVLFGRERNGWYGCAKDLVVDTVNNTPGIAALVNTINSRNVVLVADKALVAATLAGGQVEWLDPKYVAVACAGAQCGTPVATPLTEKVFDFLDIDHKWTDGSDENYVISNNICAFYRNSRGLPACLRSVTTNNDNVFYSEMSSNESVNTSIRLLRLQLKALIGSPITVDMPPSVIKGLAVASLDQQVNSGYIKAYKNVQVVLNGDKYSVDYALAPVQPLNFIEVTAHLGQF